MKNKILVLSCCLLMLVTTACGKSIPKTKNGEEIVASINGKDFTADELYLELKENYGYSYLMNMIDFAIADQEIETTDEIKDYAKQVVDMYVEYAKGMNVELKDLVAQLTGISNIETEEDFLDFVIKDRKVTLAAQKKLESKITDKEIEDYYKENYSERLTVRHILIEIEESDKDGKKALETANEVLDKLKKADKDKLDETFVDLAKEYSDDGTYNTGGLIENFMSSTVVSEFWDASNKLKDGEYTKTPVKTTYGYHIILRKSKSDKPSLEDSKDEIKEAIVAKKMENQEDRLNAMNELRKDYKLSIKDSDMEKSYNDYLDSLKESTKKSSSN